MAAEPSRSSTAQIEEPRAPLLRSEPARRRVGWRTVVRRSGQVLLAAGLLVFLFIAYELWGTSFWTHRAQSSLRHELRQKLAALPAPGHLGASLPSPDAVLAPPDGSALGRMLIPKIDLDVIVVEGIDLGDLRKGPGHNPSTPLPGRDGNVVISGHRTTYGAPFHNLDQLAPGDQIILQTEAGEFTYRVAWIRVVSPDATEVTESTPGVRELTLTTCHPKFSASQRLIVRAEQVGSPHALTNVL
jgi:sortase A